MIQNDTINWKDCLQNRIAKEVSRDDNRIKSIREISEEKLKAARFIQDEYYYAKIPLLYDVLRELLECIALEHGYKIYNHECYTAFLKEILHKSYMGDTFDKFRKLRNAINYYGKKITLEEAKEIMIKMMEFIKNLKNM